MKITGRNVNETFTDALWNMKVSGVTENTRAGVVKTIKEPVLIEHLVPKERVLFCEDRKENPIFHLMECLWMCAGRKDVEWIEQFNPRMREFAEVNGILHGAYGWRWREHFSIDQLLIVSRMLKDDPTTRRAVIQMWNAVDDLDTDAKDLPCNTHIYFRTRARTLDMTVCNRSNDLVWGALGSNVVHFSFLHELIAHTAKLQMGTMYQFTNNLHLYKRHWHFLDVPPSCEKYVDLGVRPYPVIQVNLPVWLRDCESFVKGSRRNFKEPFFSEVAVPVIEGRIEDVAAKDWKLAIERYLSKKTIKPG